VEVDTSQFRNGLRFILDGQPFVMTYFQHVKPGKGGAFVRTKVKNLVNGTGARAQLRSGERGRAGGRRRKADAVPLPRRGQPGLHGPEQLRPASFSKDTVGEARLFLKENMEVEVLFWNNKPINIDLPSFVELLSHQVRPPSQGRHGLGRHQAGHARDGAVVNVPLFIKEGDKLRIDTRTGAYVRSGEVAQGRISPRRAGRRVRSEHLLDRQLAAAGRTSK